MNQENVSATAPCVSNRRRNQGVVPKSKLCRIAKRPSAKTCKNRVMGFRQRKSMNFFMKHVAHLGVNIEFLSALCCFQGKNAQSFDTDQINKTRLVST